MNKIHSLTPDVRQVIQNKATEKPYSGIYNTFDGLGTYLCRQCGLALFQSNSKFFSSCGWPSFDSEIQNHIAYKLDADGVRTEILCARCDGHLGHVFRGEGFTPANLRHCVNSLSLDFIPHLNIPDTEEVILAGGCFWGVEYFLKNLTGVLKTEVGYIGGQVKYPTYEKVCSGQTGHLEAVRVIWDPRVLNFESLLKYYFQIHDPTQTNGQGPDLGSQYLSSIFYYDKQQKRIAQQVIQALENNGYKVATFLKPVEVFWYAENYHQQYYEKNHKQPYCHFFVRRFNI